MNPDLDQSIRSGAANTTVYLTAGEARFRPSQSDPRPLGSRLACKQGGEDELGTAALGIPTREQYIDCRRRGILSAYAALLSSDDADHTGDRRAAWRTRTLGLPGGRLAECFTSLVNPGVSLVFLDLPENADSDIEGGPQALRRLWSIPGATVRTVRAAASTLGSRAIRYDRESLVAALAALMDQTRPTVIRCLDGQPDSRYQRSWEYHDHTDHVMAGRFASLALEIHSASTNTRPVLVSYRGYNTAEAPPNLRSGSPLARKSAAFWAYAAYDTEVFDANHHEYRAWLRRMYHRWPIGTNWAAADSQGAVHAFAVVGHDLRVWWQTAEGRWRTRLLGRPTGRTLAPGVSVCPTADGELLAFVLGYDSRSAHTGCSPQVFAIRLTGADEDRQPVWTRHGGPCEGAPLSQQIGQPIAGVDGEGRVHVFVRSPDGGLSTRRQTGAGPESFSDWEFLGGSAIQYEPALVTDREGRLGIFAATASGHILRWEYTPGDPAPSPRPAIPASVPYGAPTVVLRGDGRVELFLRAANGVESWVRDGSVWRPKAVFSCSDGTGALAALALDSPRGEVLLLDRGMRGHVDPLSPDDGAGQSRVQAVSSPITMGEPAVATGRQGQAVALVLGSNGLLYTAEQTHPGPDIHLGTWQPLPMNDMA